MLQAERLNEEQLNRADIEELLESVWLLFKRSQRKEEEAQRSLLDVRTRHNRFLGDTRRARGKEGSARAAEDEARRKAEQARGRRQTADLSGRSTHHLDRQARQHAAEAERCGGDVWRLADEAERVQGRARPLADEVRERTRELEDLREIKKKWKQRFEWLARLDVAMRFDEQHPDEGASNQPVVAGQAAGAVRAILHSPVSQEGFVRAGALNQFATTELDAGAATGILDGAERLEESTNGAVSYEFAVTERATQALEDMLEDAAREPDQLLRLEVDPEGRIELFWDLAGEGDLLVRHWGADTLVVEATLADVLWGSKLDFNYHAEDGRFFLSG